MQDPLDISHHISSALNRNEAVVALESSVISQGLPSPVNVKTALEMEEAVKKNDSIPATIGVIEGKIRVGLTGKEIEKLGEGKAAKLAPRDLPYAIVKKLDGGTTVAATARIAAAAGVSVMATGGIGGVHRNWNNTRDISADLWELTRTPIVIVCSGAKAVLDVNATMEWLETAGIPVYGYQTDELPLFYSRNSGISIPRCGDIEELAEIIRMSFGALGTRSSIIVAVPPPEEDAVDVSSHIDDAIKEAEKKRISGKELTPWLLNRVGELSEGKSQKANVSLLKNNASVAAELAHAMLEDTRRRMGFMV